jgi:hypothetical protein
VRFDDLSSTGSSTGVGKSPSESNGGDRKGREHFD